MQGVNSKKDVDSFQYSCLSVCSARKGSLRKYRGSGVIAVVASGQSQLPVSSAFSYAIQ